MVILQAALLAGYTMVYVFMQTFAVPGTVSLSLLSGALFGVIRGLSLVAGLSSSPHAHILGFAGIPNEPACSYHTGAEAALLHLDLWH